MALEIWRFRRQLRQLIRTLRARHAAILPPMMPVPAVRLLEEAERLERTGEVEDMSRAMLLALRAARLVIQAQEEYQAGLALEVQARRQRILVQARLLADVWAQEEEEEEHLEAFQEELGEDH